ncbi:MAG: hypothetical protein IJK52_11025 [Oscillospiraceae bacterium]|nr:hypothetical protein [Oscillospiraceae bacterium]
MLRRDDKSRKTDSQEKKTPKLSRKPANKAPPTFGGENLANAPLMC